jgi:hypothetical protein
MAVRQQTRSLTIEFRFNYRISLLPFGIAVVEAGGPRLPELEVRPNGYLPAANKAVVSDKETPDDTTVSHCDDCHTPVRGSGL